MSVRRTRRTRPTGRRPESRGLCRSGRESVNDPGRIAASVDSVDSAEPARYGGAPGLVSRDESASSPPAVSVQADDVDARVHCPFGRAPDGNAVDHVKSRS